MDKFVSVKWHSENRENPNVIILDASYPMVGGKISKFDGLKIKGARRFEIDYFSDQESDLPHMLAPAGEFQEKARALGINQESHLVIYDNFGIYSAPRAWWMFTSMGHEKVSVLNGGLPEWIEQELPVEEVQFEKYASGDFVSAFCPSRVKTFDQIKNNIKSEEFLVIDARSAGRFSGKDPEPRHELSSGHLPSSLNVPFTEVLKDGKFKAIEELKNQFKSIDSKKPLVFSCGSGLTACITLMAAEMVLENPTAIYDGSWTEWASCGGEIEKF